MEALIILAIVLLFVTLIGHGVWEFVAWMLRGFESRKSKQTPTMECVQCGRVTRRYPCVNCGWSPAQMDDKAAARRVLSELVGKGLIEPELRTRVEDAIGRLESARPAAQVTPPPAARPVAVPVARLEAPAPIPAAVRTPTVVPPPVAEALPMPPRRPAAAAPPPAVPVQYAPVQPRRSWGEVFKSFMEERNMRWGELIGGMLIVGFSIPLVISLWAQISQRPMFKVGVFTSVVAGLFGLGLYADRRWKLPATSWGILVTATLMVPLHLAAMVVIGGQEQADVFALGVETLAVGVLGALTWLAAGVIARGWRTLVAAGVMVLSLSGPALYVSGALQATADLQHAALLAGVIVGLFVALGLGAVWQIERRSQWQAHHVREAVCAVLLLLFAAVPSLLMHAHFTSHLAHYWRVISPILAALSIPLLLASGRITMRAADAARPWRAGLWLSQLLIMAGLLCCVALSWGMPATLLVSSLVVACILGGIGYLHRDPAQLVVAMLSLLVAYCAAMPVFAGRIGWTDPGHAFWSVNIGMEILPAVAIITGAALAIRRREAVAATAGFAIAGAIAGLSLLEVLGAVYLGNTPVTGAWALFGAYAAAGLVAAIILQSRGISVVATVLAIFSLQQLALGHSAPWLIATLIVGIVWAICAAAGRWLPQRGQFAYNVLTVDGAWWTGIASVVLLVAQFPGIALPTAAIYAWVITALFALLLIGRWAAPEFAAAQLILSGAVCLQLISLLPGLPAIRLVLDCSITLLILQAIWTSLRLALNRTGRATGFLRASVSIDRMLGILAIIVSFAIATNALLDGTSSELFPRLGALSQVTQFLLGSSYHGLWLAVLAAVIVTTLEAIAGPRGWLFVTTTGIYLLAFVTAGRIWPTMTASGIRLASLVVLLCLSIPIWLRHRFPTSAGLRALAIAAGALPLVVLTLLASIANLQGIGPVAPTVGSIFAMAGAFGSYVVPMLALAAILAGHAVRDRSQPLALLSAATLNLTLTLAYLLQVGLHTPANLLQLIQLNAIAAGGFAWVWLMLFRFVANRTDDAPAGLRVLASLCIAVTMLFAGLAQLVIWAAARLPLSLTATTTLAMAWAIAILSAALLWLIWPAWTRRHAIPAGILLFSTALAATGSTFGPWIAFHVLVAGHVVAAWAVGMLRWQAAEVVETPAISPSPTDHQLTYARPDPAIAAQVLRTTGRWGIALALCALLFAFRAMLGDPQSPWWSIGALVSLASLWVTLAQRELAPGYLYPAAGAISLAVTFLWGSRYWQFTSHRVRDLVMLNILTLAGCGMASLVLELQVFAKAAGRVIRRFAPLHSTAAWVCVLTLLGISIVQIITLESLLARPDALLISGAAALAVVALLVSCLWDSAMRSAVHLLYVAGFALLALAMDLSGLHSRQFIQVSLIGSIGLTILWAILLHRWEELRGYASRFGATLYPEPGMMRTNAWLGLFSLALILGHEVLLAATTGRATMDLWLIIALSLLLLTLAGSLIAIALGKVIDVLHLPFSQRETYVYLAEAVVAVFCIHLRLTCPELFTGLFLQYWPIIAMAIAFGMAGMGEALRRRGVDVLAGPIGQTAMIIPLAPALLFGIMRSQVDYSLTLLLVSAYYIATAVVRRSAVAGILGAIALNGALWSVLWDYQTLRFDLHPQLWLIPPAMCVMLGTWLGRDRLDAKQAASLRYGALIVAYASSTADIALVGVANAPWLAGVLALLSVIGVMAGIVLRIRSFLYTGTAFLAVALLTLIYHATANLHQTWLLWLCGIGLGVAILMAFAFFERNRQKMLDTLDELRQWEA